MKRASLALVCGFLAFAVCLATARADAVADAKAFIGKQVQLIKAGDVNGVKAGVTERLRDRVTTDGLEKAQKDLGKMTLDDLVAGVEDKGDSMKVKMKNGRTLTTLVKVGGEWKADTIWFR
jgi:hypothetical protein